MTILRRNGLTTYFQHKITVDDIVCVFDDRQKVVDMWRDMGLTCMQVAPGNF
jgi:hypothetical protein